MKTKDTEDPQSNAVEPPASAPKQGGWITFPFLTGSMLGLALATSGATSNLIVYLIKEFHVKSIDAAQINNIVNGCTSLAPVAGAIISDAFFGCFPVVALSTFVNFLSMVLFTLTATVRSLRPAPCAPGSDTCDQPSAAQLATIYAAVGLLSIGMGGTRFNLMTMGADQFDRVKDQDVFFNWYFVVLYASAIVGSTAIVYVEDRLSWGLGFGLCMLANAASVVILMAGVKYYRRPKANGSPFTGLAQVVVAAIKKRKVEVGQEGMSYYHGTVKEVKSVPQVPSRSFRFLNRAAMITDRSAVDADGSVAKPWDLCTLQQVEDLKTLVRISPLWTSSIILSISIGIQASLAVLEALTMDRSLRRNGFSVPAGSIIVFTFATTVVALPIIDRLPLPSPLHRIGIGHILNTAAMAASALVERRRAAIARAQDADATVPMSVMWLVLPLAVTGLGEAFHFPGQVALYYQEFPKSLKSMATAMIALLIAVGFYASTAVIGVVRRATDWLPDNVNEGKMENVFWMLAVLGAINFGYYLFCAVLYRYQTKETNEEGGDAACENAVAG